MDISSGAYLTFMEQMCKLIKYLSIRVIQIKTLDLL